MSAQRLTKKRHGYFLLLVFVSLRYPAFTLGEKSGEGAGPSIGPNKAIVAVNPKNGFRLSPKAVVRLGLKFTKIKTKNAHRVPLKGLVFLQKQVGLYRLRDGWLKMIFVKVMSRSATDAAVETDELSQGDQIVAAGVSLARVAELDLGRSEREAHD